MGIWARIIRFFSSEANAAMDKLENAEKMADQVIREMNENLSEAIKGQAEIKAVALQHRSQEKQQREEATKWESKANQLLDRIEKKTLTEAEGESLANEAVKQYNEHTKRADEFKAMADREDQALEKINSNISTLRGTIKDYEQKAEMLKSRMKVADSTEKINKTMSTAEVDGLINTFNRMEKKVSTKEFMSQAYAEVSDDTMSSSQKIDKILGDSDNSLEAFKAKRAQKSSTSTTSN